MSKSKRKLIEAAAGILPQASADQVPTTSLGAAPAASDSAPTEAAPKKARTHRPAGLGHPNAKKLVNPQHTLELKKKAISELGGRMVWAAKAWTIKVPKGEFSIPSRELAAFSVATLLQHVQNPPPKVETPAPVVQEAAEETAAA